MYYVYIIRCSDNSLYTGITNNLSRRINEHLNKDKKCAKYTKNHDAIKLECAWSTSNRIKASKLEFYIKKLIKKDKEQLLINRNLDKYFTNLDNNDYKIVI